ncbi:Transcription initiation factor TFIID subunit 4-like protein [Dinothrombium tinctorium]|uniref:Transcription initiation factor TFIID subunit 4-like protein n=1 Tax=Dinothrombium tinctorium TaxID=1965070 RepID=A0A443RNX2_9ACAR|nr:Transcription initiation factor TFIID subunit 4-like protein [Dinothrombium tinctorium]
MASNSGCSKSAFEEMLSSDVDESAINAIVGSLESQLSSDGRALQSQPQQSQHESRANITANHVNSAQSANEGSAKRIIIAPQVNAVNKSLAATGNSQTLVANHHNNNALPSGAQSSAPICTLSGALPASGYINQVTNSPQPIGNVMQTSATSIKLNAATIANGSSSGQQTQANRLITGSNLSLSAINPQHPQIVITSNTSSSSSAGTACNQTSNVLNKTASSVSVTNKPHALLLTTTKDGPTTAMVVQTMSGNSTTAVNCETSTASVSNTNATTAAVFAVSKPITTVSTQQQPQQQQILTQVVSNPNLLPAGVVLNVNPSRPVGTTNAMSNAPTAPGVQRTLAPRVVFGGAPVRIAPQMVAGGRPGAPGVQIGQQTITLPNLRGTILVKTENGQFQLVNVAHSLPQTSTTSTIPAGTTTYRLQVPVTSATTGQQNVATAGTPMRSQQMTVTLPASVASAIQRPMNVTQPLTIQTTTANTRSAATPSQMSPNTAKEKCKNFLSTLIKLASDQPEPIAMNVATNVKNLIQGLIDGRIQPEEFTNQLQRELNSSPQPCLVPFLKKSLPYLRHSLMLREMTIDGVKPPRPGSVQLPPQQQTIPQIQVEMIKLSRFNYFKIAHPARPGAPTTVRFLTTAPGLAAQLAQGTAVLTAPRPPQPSLSATTLNATPTLISSNKLPTTPTSTPSSKFKATAAKARSPASSKDKEKKSFSSGLRDDDDINDVAAMGGVNLVEESQRILATNAEFVGTQIRSCKDENFLFTNPLQSCINQIASKFGLEEVSSEVVSLVSHAAQERLKNLVEKLGIIAEHRIENIKNDPRYEITQDVRGQSRSKLEDPEQLKLKQKAKEMQRAELEEVRQREANETALLAIGPRKKLKVSQNSALNVNSNAFNSNTSNHISSSPFSNEKSQIRRLKRVNIRDLLFLMEQERETVRTPMLYRAYAK